MNRYAKLNEDGSLELFKGITNRANPSAALIKARATQAGYKLIVQHARAHRLTELKYRATAKEIQAEWIDLPLEQAREQVLGDIISWANAFKAAALRQYKFSDIEVLQKDEVLSDEELAQQAAARQITVEELKAKIATSKAAAQQLITMGRAMQDSLWDAAHAAQTVAELAAITWEGVSDAV